MNHTLSAIKQCPRAVVLNLIDAMHIKRLVIQWDSEPQRVDPILLLIMYGSRFKVYESNFARSVKTAVAQYYIKADIYKS